MTETLKIKDSVLFGSLVMGNWELFGIWNLVLGD
jgi:hypothetical protein